MKKDAESEISRTWTQDQNGWGVSEFYFPINNAILADFDVFEYPTIEKGINDY